MTGWRLDPSGIGTTLTQTTTSIETVASAVQGIATSAGDDLVQGAGFDGIVVQALSGFLEEQATSRLQPMMNRYSAALQAAADATNAFLAGDEQMAASSMQQAGAAALVSDGSGYTRGYAVG